MQYLRTYFYRHPPTWIHSTVHLHICISKNGYPSLWSASWTKFVHMTSQFHFRTIPQYILSAAIEKVMAHMKIYQVEKKYHIFRPSAKTIQNFVNKIKVYILCWTKSSAIQQYFILLSVNKKYLNSERCKYRSLILSINM